MIAPPGRALLRAGRLVGRVEEGGDFRIVGEHPVVEVPGQGFAMLGQDQRGGFHNGDGLSAEHVASLICICYTYYDYSAAFPSLQDPMQLTIFTDYGLRSLMFLAAQPDKVCSVREIADHYGISRNHLVKVVHRLAQLGYITSSKGKGGGIRLACDANKLKIGDLVRKLEPICRSWNVSTARPTPARSSAPVVSNTFSARPVRPFWMSSTNTAWPTR